MSDIQPGQIWRVNFSNRTPVRIKCVGEQDDKFVFWVAPRYGYKVPLIYVYKDRLDFFLDKSTLEERISAESN